ncbi:MAG TPA: nitroreductase family deazaflavin-dependent oxidoreductase [Candidatus Limnocylindrales bacterium]|nr:nitroreductase family deazaflavin-dependent oxidoreductase [Candidatus Limnocylindrales bacterium]
MTQTLHPPRGINLFNSVAKPLLAAGMPMGFNGLLTVRGRKSGVPRTTALAVIEAGGRRWVWSPWGEVQWVRNLRAAGRATVTVRRQESSVRAIELDPEQRIGFFRDTLAPLAHGMRGGAWFIRTFDGVDVDDPVKAAEGRAVFELVPAAGV